MEEREDNAAGKASSLVASFAHLFYRMSYTVHPSGIPGEAQGKSSNESWAAKQAMLDYQDPQMRRDIIFTTMDADTHLSCRYFEHIARLHTECVDTNQATIYVPPLVFDRNLHRVPLPVRTADMLWAGAGLSSMYAGSSICIPTSVYSLPMALVEFVGGWDTGPGAIGEDLHMYVKCFFAMAGNLKVQVVHAAASQCNVSSDRDGVRGYFDGLYARYRQALRHMWGAMDTGFAIREAAKMVHRQRASCGSSHRGDHLPLSASASPYKAPRTLISDLSGVARAAAMPINITNVAILAHRLFEAHFLPIHLAVMMVASALYTALCPPFLVPTALRLGLEFAGWCRLAGFLAMLFFYYRYERYHRLCVALRQEEMRRAGLLPDAHDGDDGNYDDDAAHEHFSMEIFQVAGLLEVALFPLGGFLFGAIPALQATLCHFFTERLTYVVSLKPQFALRPWRDVSRLAP